VYNEARGRNFLKLQKCLETCMSTKNLLFDEEKKLNKTAMKSMYEFTVQNSYGTHWMTLINEAVDNCEPKSTESITEILATFLNCIEDHLANNCIEFNLFEDACVATFEQFEKCKKIKQNCSVWPASLMSPQSCCLVPSLISNTLLRSCRSQCEEKEFFLQLLDSCIQKCHSEGAKINSSGNFDFEAVKSMLFENSDKSVDWKATIDEAVDMAEKWMNSEIIRIFLNPEDLKFYKFFRSFYRRVEILDAENGY
jgi:hypothetical protein